MSLEDDIGAIVRLIRNDVTIGTTTDDGQDGWINDDQEVSFGILGYRRQGADERRTSVEALDLRERIYGNRTLLIQFTINTNKQTLENTAIEIADDLIAGFAGSDVEALLAVHELGVPRCDDPRAITLVDAHKDGRSTAVFVARFPASRRHTGGLTTSIQEVAITGEAAGSTEHGISLDVST